MIETPTANETSVVTFYDRSLKARLSAGTLSPGQAAKRDLARYHALIDDALPAIYPENAIALVYMVRGSGPASPPELAAHTPVQRLALLDAADRAIAEYERTPDPHLPEIVARHFRITPERYR